MKSCSPLRRSPKQTCSRYKTFKLYWSRGTGHKKYKVVITDLNGVKLKTVQFGDKRYEQYKDSVPLKLYSHLNHNDKNRRRLYKNRHEKDRHNHFTAGWFADKYLW